ncbi:MAG: hydroxysqualene dehydroxylase HpnE [Phycisphaerae bacterium]
MNSHSDETKPPTAGVIIVGGGLAGIAAAAALDSCGYPVTLLEARRTLGGRASSFEDPQSAQLLDNCQHVLLGCCTNLRDLYKRLNVADRIEYHRRVHFLDAAGKQFDLWGAAGLPAPLHLAPALLGFGALTFRERREVITAMLAMLRLGKSGREKMEGQPFGQWLMDHRQSDRVIQRFYDPLLLSALNENTRNASSQYAIAVFQDAMLLNQHGYVTGWPTGSLGELYAHRPCRDVRLGARVSRIVFAEGRAAGVALQTGETIAADAVILATNHHAVRRLIPENLQAIDSRFDHLDKLESVPILGVHLWFDKPVMRLSHAALLEGPLQWLFRKDAEGKILHGVISAARTWVAQPHDQCAGLFARQIQQLFPAAAARLLRYKIVIEKRATFSPVPGTDVWRPPQAPPPGGIENLFLAGDYTRTHWPATMEGAVRSGYLAAAALTRRIPLGGAFISAKTFMIADLPMEWPARMLVHRARS